MTRSKLLTAIALAILCAPSACGSHTNTPNGPCAHFVRALFANDKCGPPFPDGEVARLEARFDPVCRGELRLPGSNVTEAMLEACATALESQCWPTKAVPPECVFHGTLPVGESCYGGHQCQTGGCADGVCVAPIAAGETCTTNVPCIDGTSCTWDGDSRSTCVPTAYGAAGESCDGHAKDCEGALVCHVPPTCADTTCGRCDTADPPKPAGATCLIDDDTECASGLGCVTGKCAPVTWVEPGGACGHADTWCTVGACDVESTGSTCPQILPDGAPCAADSKLQSCDTFAACIGGVCERNHTLGWPRTIW